MGKRSQEVRARRLERERLSTRSHHRVAATDQRGCLFCRQTDRPFHSVEHVFAESLGNTSYVLPKGVVCDTCNHQTLSTLDQALVGFMPISLRLTMLGVPNKAGKHRVLSLQGDTYEHIPSPTGNSELHMVVRSKIKGRSAIREVARYSDGRVKFQMSGTGGRRLTPRYASELSRAMLKSALECAWKDHGATMLESRFDHIRQAVLGEPRDGFFAFAADCPEPNSVEVSLAYDLVQEDGRWRMPVWMTAFGVPLHTDSRLAEPPAQLRSPDDWNVIEFKATELRSRQARDGTGPDAPS